MPTFDNFYFISSTGVNRIRVKTCTPDGEVRGVVQIDRIFASLLRESVEFVVRKTEGNVVPFKTDFRGVGAA